MFVAEEGHRTAAVFDDVEDLVEEFEARVKVLAELIAGVIAMFADEDDGVDREFRATLAEGFADAGVDAKAVASGQVARHVVGGDLVRIERHDVGAGRVPGAVRRVAAQQASDDDIGVGPMPVLGDDGGYARSPAAGGERQGGGEAGELAAREHAKSIAELDGSGGDV